MKFSSDVTSSRRKCRKAHFQAPSSIRHKIMSCNLHKDIREKYNVRTAPVRKDDEVRVMRGKHKGHEGKVIQCYRKKYVIYIDRLTHDKVNGATVNIGIAPSNCQIIKLKLDKDRLQMLSRRDRSKEVKMA
ncbi:60S ribosomal protein L26A [Entomophthora muscae]|uniref:60S ribosomal protein L26A n=2 Tax=Entomophthora muscae TaxID=34485 RepID=A0ACC2U5L0_9FUNG|nr:60S ribosomal protein L26A [Entomophthora muscae]KAJ9082032.1 60S ribosomal protein L26A [Entomophthora muscae]